MEMQPEFRIEIAFGEIEAIKGKPVATTLSQITGAVDGIAQAFIAAGLLK
jgi:hypothetical protein